VVGVTRYNLLPQVYEIKPVNASRLCRKQFTCGILKQTGPPLIERLYNTYKWFVVVQFAAERTKNRTSACLVCAPYVNGQIAKKPGPSNQTGTPGNHNCKVGSFLPTVANQ